MIHVGHLAPEDCWDQNIVTLLTTNELHPTGLNFKHHTGFPNTDDGCILTIPGAYWGAHYDRINAAIARYPWVLAFRVSDEKDTFNTDRIWHQNLRWWVQTPRADRDYGGARLFGCGFPPHFNKLPAKPLPKTLNVFLSGQNTHERRQQCFEALKPYRGEDNPIWSTEGFTQGVTPGEYALMMANTKVAPAPSGIFSPDSFRLYEALEAGAVPIADDISPQYDSRGYWRKLFPDAPFPIFTDYSDLPGLVDSALAEWPSNANRISEWWTVQKQGYSEWLVEDLRALGAICVSV